MSEVVAQLKQTNQEDNWPQPGGWRLLVDPLKPKSVSDGGIILAEETQIAQVHLNYVGRVISLGPLCYRHPKFGDTYAPWCKAGDFIAYGQYAGQTITVKDQSAIDEVARMREEIKAMEEDVAIETKQVLGFTGSPKHAELQKALVGMKNDLSNMRKSLIEMEDETEHRLRLLNDDEVLATIPRTDAIKIYL